MMKCQILLLTLSLYWNHVVSQSCVTPMGVSSNCISIFDCTPLSEAFTERPIRREVIAYLRKSSCGFDRNTPKVCCGPMPSGLMSTPVSTTARPMLSNGRADPVSSEDSRPAPEGVCGKDEGGDRIYGGQFTELGEFSWMALLGYLTADRSLAYQCGGVLINKRYVLTAAHCVVGEIEKVVGKLATVRLGEYDIDSDRDCIENECADPHQEIRVLSAHPHPGFVDGQVNREDDIALVRLAQRVKYSDFVHPICLPNSMYPSTGTEVYVAGWGKTLRGTRSPVKLKLAVPIFDTAKCFSKYRGLGAALTNKQLCAGGTFAEDACKGDSGGPLMRSRPDGVWESVGVVSFGYGCGRDGWPGVYSSTYTYKNWILETMRSTNV